MRDVQELHDIFAAVGKRLDVGEVVAFEDRSYWRIRVTEEMGISVFAHDEGRRLMFESLVLQMRPEDVSRFFQLMLQFNYLWDETGGVRFAIEPTENLIVLQYELPTDQADEDTVATVLNNLDTLTMRWRNIIETTPVEDDALGDMADAVMMRV